MKFKSTVKSEDSLKAFMNKVTKLTEYKAEAGFYKEQYHSESKMSMANLATILNYGVKNGEKGWKIPPRPFFYKAWIASLNIDSKDTCMAVRSYLYGGKPIRTVFKELADKLAQRVTMAITAGSSATIPDNAEVTIRLKGFNYPLVETGKLASSVKSKVKTKTKGKAK